MILECETQGGYPEPKLSWWRNGQLIDDSYEIVSGLDNSVIERYRGSVVATLDGPTAAVSLDGTGETISSDEPRGVSAASSAFASASSSSGASSDGDNESLLESSYQENNSDAAAEIEPTGSTTSSMTDSSSNSASSRMGKLGNRLGGQVTQNRLIRNRLELVALTRADLLANYSCQAWNTKLSGAPTSSVMIDINRKYLSFAHISFVFSREQKKKD